MRLVGLISGGKDSLFNLLQCIAAGHEIVAVANVEPYNKEELESYMYQSVGHEIIALVAEALELPIYRQKTRGQAVCKSKTYTETAHDEVEDLFILLNKVKKEMHIEGVSVGAITSDYQRTRVENICSRLGLLCFAYLWKRDQEELLQEMIDAELDAIVIKVATIGLNPEVHLGMHIKDIKSHLIDLNKKFGVHICGEGGEYETMTIDCPLFHRMINISETQNIILSNDAFAPSAYLTVKKALLQPKKWGSDDPKETLKTRLSHIRAIVKNPYNYIQDCVDDISTEIVPHSHTLSSLEGLRFNFSRIRSKGNLANSQEYWKKSSKVFQQPHSSQQGTKITQVSAIDTTICKLNSATGWCCLGNVSGLTLLDAFYCMQKHLDKAKYNMEDVVFLSLYIRDISEFQNLNKTYAQFIPSTLPPARACVSTRLPPEIGVLIIAIAHRHFSKGKKTQKETSDRVTMHVQSISHWAPANIGPYSQCVKIGGLYYLAGQIPLVPGTMEILNKPIFHQCKLALRHALRVMQAMNDGLQYSNVLQAICYVTSTEVAADIPFLWSFISKNECATLASVVVTALPKNAELEWEILACDFQDPQVKEEEAHVEDYYIQMKRCVYKDPFASSLVCKISHPKKLMNSSQKTLKIVTSNGISTVLGHCLDFLRGDLKTLGSYICILKLFYKSSDSVMGTVLKDITKTFGHKVVATVIPVVACPDDVFLTVAGVCH